MSDRKAGPPLLGAEEKMDDAWMQVGSGDAGNLGQLALEKPNAVPASTSPRNRSQSQPDLARPEYPGLTASSIAESGAFRREPLLARGMSLDDTVTLFDLVFSGPSIIRRFGGGLPRDDSDSEDDGDDDEEEDVDVEGEGRKLVRGKGPDGYEVLPEGASKKRPRRTKGGSSIVKLVVTILKSFVGSAVLFLPKAFENGGIVFSPIVLLGMATLSIYCMLLLIECRKACPGTYGAIGKRAFGNAGLRFVNFSLVFSQIGFCCAYVVFVAKNASHLVTVFFDKDAGLIWFILLQLPILVPLAWVRRIRKFAVTNLIADAFILVGLLAILVYSGVTVLHPEGKGAHRTVQPFNSVEFPVFLGTSVYTFEGIGLLIPIHQSTSGHARKRFSFVLTATLAGVCMFFVLFSCLGYAAFGEQVQTVITLNLPQSASARWWVSSLQIGYSIALVLTFPLMLFPATRILEGAAFSGWVKSTKRMWAKNAFRALLVIFCCAISYAGADELDKFVSLIGSVCCVPLAFIYPSLFHFRLVAKTPFQRAIDAALATFGFGTLLFTLTETLRQW